MAKIKLINRPEWNDTDTYPDHKNWSFDVWAWEFLRRNEDFQAACENAINGSEENKARIAKQYGLQNFKSFREDFFAGADCQWLSVLPKVLASQKLQVKELPITAIPGQVIISFDLNEILKNRPTLVAQIFNAKAYIDVQLKEFAKSKKSKIYSPKHQVDKLL